MRLDKGNWPEIASAADHVLTDSVEIGGQAHFYLEPHGSLAIPNGEDGEIILYSSAQHPSEVQVRFVQCFTMFDILNVNTDLV